MSNYLGPRIGTTNTYCSWFEENPQNGQKCAFGDVQSVLWKYSDSRDCRNKCTEFATLEGPGCCAFSNKGVCSYHTKGTIVNMGTTSAVTARAVYCTRSDEKGKSSPCW